jgi:hypothetical protein
MSASEKIGRGAWEAARFREYDTMSLSIFLCNIVAGDKNLVGILEVNKYGKETNGALKIPIRVTRNSPLATQAERNRVYFANPDNYKAIAEELGLGFNRYYEGLNVSSLGENRHGLGVTGSLMVSNYSFTGAPEASELGDTGRAMGLAKYMVDSLPGGWQITPEPVISR